MFELDEAVRQKAKEAAAAGRSAAASTEDNGVATIEHIILSYIWEYQEVIKRINAAL